MTEHEIICCLNQRSGGGITLIAERFATLREENERLKRLLESVDSPSSAAHELLVSYFRGRLDELKHQLTAVTEERDKLRERNELLYKSNMTRNEEVLQTLGKALGYPWFKDDQKNFPGATEKDGICPGEHVAESMAEEAANYIRKLEKSAACWDKLCGWLCKDWHRVLIFEKTSGGCFVIKYATANGIYRSSYSDESWAECLRQIQEATEQ